MGSMMTFKGTAFYQGKIYDEYTDWLDTRSLPDGAYVRCEWGSGLVYWYQKGYNYPDIDTILLDDVPKELLALFWNTGDYTWYLKKIGNLSPINSCDVPSHIKAMCLLIN